MVVTNFIIGMAGHARHGKTALVGALTGLDHSVDLGFAPLYLPCGITAGIVDVPGSSRFTKNILAGFTGVDLLIIVVAADEGVCAQTTEHLDFAVLLGISRVIVALTKIDSVDSDREAEVRSAIGDLLASRSLVPTATVSISVPRQEGLSELVAAIEEGAHDLSPRSLDLPIRLPIDRSFVLPAAGRVVTGVLWSGVLAAAGELELVQSKEVCRPLRVEVYGQLVSKALPGQPVALNMIVSGDPPERGDWVAAPGVLMPAREIIAQARILPGCRHGLRDGAIVWVHHGTRAVPAHIYLVEGDKLEPGGEGFVQVVPRQPLSAVVRDRFVFRTVSSPVTVGGGTVIETSSRARGRPAGAHWRVLAGGDESEIVKELFGRCLQPLTIEDVAQASYLGESTAAAVAETLVKKGVLRAVKVRRRAFYLDSALLDGAGRDLRNHLDDYRRQHPYDFGPKVEKVRIELWPHLSSSQADIILTHFINEGLTVLTEERLGVRAASESAPARRKMVELYRKLKGFSPPDRAELEQSQEIDTADLNHLLARLEAEGRIIQPAPDIYFTVEAIGEARETLMDYLLEAGEITEARFCELLGTNNKYAGPLCLYFDQERLTRRAGEVRVLYGL